LRYYDKLRACYSWRSISTLPSRTTGGLLAQFDDPCLGVKIGPVDEGGIGRPPEFSFWLSLRVGTNIFTSLRLVRVDMPLNIRSEAVNQLSPNGLLPACI
jgi:hypothetical protein